MDTQNAHSGTEEVNYPEASFGTASLDQAASCVLNKTINTDDFNDKLKHLMIYNFMIFICKLMIYL